MTAATAMDRRSSVDAAAAAIMVGLTFSWGLNYVAAKISYAGYDPVFLSIARSVIGGLCVLVWCRWRGIVLFTRDGTLVAGILAGALLVSSSCFSMSGSNRRPSRATPCWSTPCRSGCWSAGISC